MLISRSAIAAIAVADIAVADIAVTAITVPSSISSVSHPSAHNNSFMRVLPVRCASAGIAFLCCHRHRRRSRIVRARPRPPLHFAASQSRCSPSSGAP